jgi:hypothetical protein
MCEASSRPGDTAMRDATRATDTIASGGPHCQAGAGNGK